MILFYYKKVDESMKSINKKGITLVELLAVLIVLILIFLLAITRVNDVLDDSERKAVKADAISYMKAVNDFFMLNNGTLLYPEYEGLYTYDELNNLGVKVSGTKPNDGFILNINNKTIYGCLTYEKRRAVIKNNEVVTIDTKKCNLKTTGYDSNVNIFFAQYKGSETVFTVSVPGLYKLEAWGAQGGDSHYNAYYQEGGYGAYSVGYINLNEGDKLYINVGGQGTSVNYKQSSGNIIEYSKTNGYNGGGAANTWNGNSSHGGGGGATSIALRSGLLSTLENYVDDILIVAGAGGGAATHVSNPSYSGRGGSGGGYNGVNGIPGNNTCYNYGTGGTQEQPGSFNACITDGRTNRGDNPPTNPSFGAGSARPTNHNSSTYGAGGAGFYGGGSGWHGPGAGGSGYIGNDLLKNKVMYCYMCDETDIEDAKTISTNNVSEEPIAKYAKKGNGYVRISLIEKTNLNNP